MRTIARAFFVAAVVAAWACADPGVTTPTSPSIPIGIPQTLTLAASPTTITASGGLVRVAAAITVPPGTRMPGTLSLQMPGTNAASLIPLLSDGRLEESFWIAQGGDLIATAGTLERRVTITQLSNPIPPPIPPPPTPGPPVPVPPPEPTPPAYTLTLTPKVVAVSGATDPLRVNQDLKFSVTVEPLPGGDPLAGVVLTYEWIVKDGFTIVTAGITNPLTYKLTHTGATSAGVTVTTSDGRSAYARVEFTIVP